MNFDSGSRSNLSSFTPDRRPQLRITLLSLFQEPISHRLMCRMIGVLHDEGGIVIQGFENHGYPHVNAP
jgi:hypothetical protein